MKTLLLSLVMIAQAVVGVDPAAVVGPIKPMNAGNNGPYDPIMESYTALRTPL